MTDSDSAADGAQSDRLLRRGRAARLMRVNPRTIRRWADAGLIESVPMPNGELRYWENDLRGFIQPAARGTVSAGSTAVSAAL